MAELKKALEGLKKDAYEEYKEKDIPSKAEALSYFGRCVSYSFELIFKEKEIITFALLQLVCIGLGYYLWSQIWNFIPEEALRSENHADSSAINMVLTLWSLICVGLTTYPLGLLTACMGAAHFLHEKGEESTIAKCFRIVLPRAWSIWVFSWIDGWWTIKRRFFSKRNRSIAQRVFDETLYQAWKVASLGFLPALIIGRSVKDSCLDSLKLLKTNFKYICLLRLAYSALCWFVGIGAFALFIFMAPHMRLYLSGNSDVYYMFFCLWVGIPLLVALLFIQVIFRPIYILSACRIYSNYVRENEIPIVLPTVSKFSSSIVAFLVLCVIVGALFLYRDELGITQMLSASYF